MNNTTKSIFYNNIRIVENLSIIQEKKLAFHKYNIFDFMKFITKLIVFQHFFEFIFISNIQNSKKMRNILLLNICVRCM